MNEIKFSCYNCGQKMAVESRGAGMMINCPTCQSLNVIPQSSSNILSIVPVPPAPVFVTNRQKQKSIGWGVFNGMVGFFILLPLCVILLGGLTIGGCALFIGSQHSNLNDISTNNIDFKREEMKKRIQQAQDKSDFKYNQMKIAKSSVVLMDDWTFQVTDRIGNVKITDGPVVFIKLSINNPTPFKVTNAKLVVSFTDDYGNKLGGSYIFDVFNAGGLDFVKPKSIKDTTKIFGGKNVDFNLRLVHKMYMYLETVELSD